MTRELRSTQQRYWQAAQRQRLEREMLKSPVPERITAALDMRQLYGPEVDIACGVVEPAVDMWEAGTLVPTPAQVEALARLTGFPLAYFYMPMKPWINVGWLCGTNGCEVIDNRPGADIHQLPAGQLTLFGGM